MVRYLTSVTVPGGAEYIEIACVSTDTKPSGGNLATGSVAIEVDTGDIYMYNEASSTWVKQN